VSSIGPFLHPFARPAATDFVKIVGGEGAYVWDDQGQRYVDALAGLWYCNLGHGRAEIADAVADVLRTLGPFHTFERFTNEPAEVLTATLASLAPMPDARVFLTCSGSEAVDSAIKLAHMAHTLRGDPERTVVVSRTNAYHGVTYGGLSVQGIAPNQAGFGPLLPDVVVVDHDDLDAAAAVFADQGDRIAAVIAEPVIGAGGVHPPAPGYLRGLRELCDRSGAFLVLDEVICGFGRLGRWWGAERYEVVPDLVTFAKAVTSGYQPLGGVLVGRAVREPLEADPTFVLRHGHTYSGHPAACAAGNVAIELTRQEGLLDRAVKIGDQLAMGLGQLVSDGLLAQARGAGAVWAAVLHDDRAVEVRDRMMTMGVLARPLGPSVIAFCPPLVAPEGAIEQCIDALGRSLPVTTEPR
jgi:adenosylmethionine-8-amino-7-oxononanoate aminotransferase